MAKNIANINIDILSAQNININIIKISIKVLKRSVRSFYQYFERSNEHLLAQRACYIIYYIIFLFYILLYCIFILYFIDILSAQNINILNTWYFYQYFYS